MDKKLDIHIVGDYLLSDIKEFVIDDLTLDYLIDRILQSIKEYSSVDFKDICDKIQKMVEESQSLVFSDLYKWNKNKKYLSSSLIGVVGDMDILLFDNKKIEKTGDFISTISKAVQKYLLNLNFLHITEENISFDTKFVKLDYVERLVKQINTIDKNDFLFKMLVNIPNVENVDYKRFENKTLEVKLKKFNDSTKLIKSKLDKNFKDLHNTLKKAYNDFDYIMNSSLLDGEKELKVRHASKVFTKHINYLDKIKYIVTECNEIKRQLNLSKNKLINEKASKIADYNEKINVLKVDRDILIKDRDSYSYMMDLYVKRINSCEGVLSVINQEIDKQWVILEKLENLFITAIPSEAELKRYSKLVARYQDVIVKLKMLIEQLPEKNASVRFGINTVIKGIEVIIKYCDKAKDLFMRNTFMSTIFGSVNVMYDLVDDVEKFNEVEKIKFVTEKISEYSKTNLDFSIDIVKYRDFLNTCLESILKLIDSDFSARKMLTISENIVDYMEDIKERYDNLDNSNKNQAKLIECILNV